MDDNLETLTKEDVELIRTALKAFSQAMERQHLYVDSLLIPKANKALRDKDETEYLRIDAQMTERFQLRNSIDEHLFRVGAKIGRIYDRLQNPSK